MLQSNGVLLGRFLLGLLFFSSGVNILMGGVGNTSAYFESLGLPMAMLLTYAVLALKLVAGGGLMLGWKVEECATALFVFTLLTIFIAHRSMEDVNLWKNLAIMGGLLYAMAYGAGNGWRLSRS